MLAFTCLHLHLPPLPADFPSPIHTSRTPSISVRICVIALCSGSASCAFNFISRTLFCFSVFVLCLLCLQPLHLSSVYTYNHLCCDSDPARTFHFFSCLSFSKKRAYIVISVSLFLLISWSASILAFISYYCNEAVTLKVTFSLLTHCLFAKSGRIQKTCKVICAAWGNWSTII